MERYMNEVHESLRSLRPMVRCVNEVHESPGPLRSMVWCVDKLHESLGSMTKSKNLLRFTGLKNCQVKEERRGSV